MEQKGYFVSDIPRRTFLGRSVKGGIAVAAAPTLVSVPESCASGDLSAQARRWRSTSR
jgi:TldD protein